ncbi:FtsX-like permease family protein [Actinoplanes sp. NPDC049265]|uniref:FtsX-like permease family protein n=1 Tax=Actinoplanes sp. NPDC049265 TaxID=3363902 RepID=UPI0037131233
MRPGTLFRLALAGSRTDRLRTGLTAGSAALAAVALLAAATVAAIDGGAPGPDGELTAGSSQYASTLLVESGLRSGVVIALVMLALPVLALAGQCVRLGAPARDRRLAAIRLAGATPGQAALIAAAETFVAGILGSAAGFGGYLLLRVLLERRTPQGLLVLPTDVLPSTATITVLLLIVPLAAALIGMLLLRRVLIGPLGVLRRGRKRSPKPWPGLLIAAGLILFDGPSHLRDNALSPNTTATIMGVGVVSTMVGVVLGTGWISYTAGRVLHRVGRRPAILLASRRLMADPWNGSRTLAALLTGILAGAIALGYREMMITGFAADAKINALSTDGTTQGSAAPDEFYLGALRLVLIAVAVALVVATAGVLVAMVESIVARSRSYAALNAVGVPRRTLSESILWHTFTPLLPAAAIALTAGTGLARLMGTTEKRTETQTICTGTSAQCETGEPPYVQWVTKHEIVLNIPVPWTGLALLAAVVLAAMLLATVAGLLVLRSTTDLSELRTA